MKRWTLNIALAAGVLAGALGPLLARSPRDDWE